MNDYSETINQFEHYQKSGWSKSEVPNSQCLVTALKAMHELATYKLALELACEQISDYALPSGTEGMKDKLSAGRYELFIKRAKSRRKGQNEHS